MNHFFHTFHIITWPVLQHPARGDMRGWSPPEPSEELMGDGPTVDADEFHLSFPPNSSVPPYFVYWRPPVSGNYIISPTSRPNTLALAPSYLNLTGLDGNSPGQGGITFISRRQVSTLFTYSLVFDYEPTLHREEAGMSLFLSQNHHARCGITMLPAANSTEGKPTPHFHFYTVSSVPVPADVIVPIPEAWCVMPIRLHLQTVNQTHYEFGATPADESERPHHIATVAGDIVSWGFTGSLVGAYATSNGGNGTTKAYVTDWHYESWGQVRDVCLMHDCAS